MPLTFPVKRKTKFLSTIGQTIQRSLAYIRPDVILAVMLIISIILAFLQIPAISFHCILGVFIVGYFTDRIIPKIWKKKYGKSTQKK